MATITKEQYQKRQAAAPAGWQYDFRHYVMWGENQLTRKIPFPDGSVILATVYWAENYRNEVFPSGYSRSVPTGTVSPFLGISRLVESRPGSDVWMSRGTDRREQLSEKEYPRKNYKELCKYAAAVPDSRIMALLPGNLQNAM